MEKCIMVAVKGATTRFEMLEALINALAEEMLDGKKEGVSNRKMVDEVSNRLYDVVEEMEAAKQE